MENWTYLILVATSLYGVMNFLFKVAAERGLDADRVVSVTGVTVAALALGTVLVSPLNLGKAFTTQALTYALFNGLAFGMSTLCKFAALKRAPAAVVFPINRLSTVLVMVAGFVLFKEVPTALQYIGMVLAFGVILVVAAEHLSRTGSSAAQSSGILFALASALLMAFSMTVGKLAADSTTNLPAYICCSYSLVFLITFGLGRARRAASPRTLAIFDPPALLYGILIGIFNYAGYFLLLRAFAHGPLSLVQAVFSTSIVIPILLAYLVYREHLTRYRVLAIALAIVAVSLVSV